MSLRIDAVAQSYLKRFFGHQSRTVPLRGRYEFSPQIGLHFYPVAMRIESDDGFVREQIALSISISEPSSNFARFWEGSNESETADGKSVIEFFLNPPDVVKALPDNASKNNQGSQSQQRQQLMELLTGLRAYAEVIPFYPNFREPPTYH